MLHLLAAPPVAPTPSTHWDWKPGQFSPVPAYLIVSFAAVIGIMISRQIAKERGFGGPGAMQRGAMTGFGDGQFLDYDSGPGPSKRGRNTDLFELLLVATAVMSLATISVVHAITIWSSRNITTWTSSMSAGNATTTVAVATVVLLLLFGTIYMRTENEIVTVLFGLVVLVYGNYQPQVGKILTWVTNYILSFIWYFVFWAIGWIGHFNLGVSGATATTITYEKWNWTHGTFAPVPPYLIVSLAAVLAIVAVRSFTMRKVGTLSLLGKVLELAIMASAIASLAQVTLIKALGLFFSHLIDHLAKWIFGGGGTAIIASIATVAIFFLGRKYLDEDCTPKERAIVSGIFVFVALILVSDIPWVQERLQWIIQNPLSLAWYGFFFIIAWLGHFTLGIKGA